MTARRVKRSSKPRKRVRHTAALSKQQILKAAIAEFALKGLDGARVDEIARSMLSDGQTTPILVRADGARFVLIEGLHRLEAARALGERTIVGFRVDARKH